MDMLKTLIGLAFATPIAAAFAAEIPTFLVLRTGPTVDYYNECSASVNQLMPGSPDTSVINVRTCETKDTHETPGPAWAAPDAPTYGKIFLPDGSVTRGCALVESRVLLNGSSAAQYVTVECPGNEVFGDGFDLG